MKNIIIGIIIGGIVFTLGGVVATTAISSTNITYQNKTVNSALDELYNEATTGKELVAAAITNKGIATTSSDTYETMATNISSIDTDHTEINQKINNLESKHKSDIASLTGSITSLNQNLTVLKSEFVSYNYSYQGNKIRFMKRGNVVSISIPIFSGVPSGYSIFCNSIPAEYIPTYTVSFDAFGTNSGTLTRYGFAVRNNGKIEIYNYGSYTGSENVGATFTYVL